MLSTVAANPVAQPRVGLMKPTLWRSVDTPDAWACHEAPPSLVVRMTPLAPTAHASVGLDAGYHHLYEYGTIGIFCALGRYEQTAAGRTEVTARFTFDERVADGLYAQRSLELFRSLIEQPEAAAVEVSARRAG